MRAKLQIKKLELKKLYEKEKLSICKIAKKFNCSTATIQRRLHEFNLNVRIRNLKIPRLEDNISKEKAYILGVLCGDGYISVSKNSTYEIGLRTIDREFVLAFNLGIEKTYGLTPRIRIISGGIHKIRGKIYITKKLFHVRINSKKIYEDISRYGKFKTENWRVPKEIITLKNEEIICSFLRGFLDSEATPREYSFFISSSNKRGLKDIKKLLSHIGIERFHLYVDNKGVWRLYFCGKDNLFIICKKVGFTIKRKQEKLKEATKFKHNNDTSKYWLVLNLRMQGYGYRKISKLTGIPKWNARDWYEGRHIPLSVRREIKLKNTPKNWDELCKHYLFLTVKFAPKKPY